MSEEKKHELAQRRVEAITLASTLDELVAQGAQAYIASTAGSMAETMALAVATAEIQKALTPDIMKPIMSLQGTSIGFKTDKTYSEKDVKLAMVESLIKGVPMAGNCTNIIAGRQYTTKEGFTFLINGLIKSGAVHDFDYALEVPQKDGNRTTVKGKATWKQNNEEQSVESTFPIRTNGGSTDDNTLGKAERKLKARCYERMTGLNLADGDTDGMVTVQGESCSPLDRDQDRRQDALNSRIPEARKVLVDCNPEIVRKCFEDQGYESSCGSFDEWLDEVMDQVVSAYILDSIVAQIEKETKESE